MLAPPSGQFSLDVDEDALRSESRPGGMAPLSPEITGLGVAPSPRAAYRRPASGANVAVSPSSYPGAAPQPMRVGTGPQPLVRRATTGEQAVVRPSRPASYQLHPGLAVGLGKAPAILFQGKGPVWLVLALGAGALVAGFAIASANFGLSGPIALGLRGLAGVAALALFGVAVGVHRVAVQLGRDERRGVESGLWLEDLRGTELVFGGLGSALLLALWSAPAIAAAASGAPPLAAILLGVLPAFFWPVSLGLRATNGLGGAFHPGHPLRVVLGGGLAFVVQGLLGAFAISAVVATGRALLPLLANEPLPLVGTALAVTLLAGLLTYALAATGYVFGLRAGSDPAAFDFLARRD